MIIGCASSTGLPQRDERVRVATAPAGERPDKDVEILVLRHQIMILQLQLGMTRPRLSHSDRVFLAALLHRLPRDVLGQIRLLVRPETVLRSLAPGPAGAPACG
jgi:hypothetical protein